MELFEVKQKRWVELTDVNGPLQIFVEIFRRRYHFYSYTLMLFFDETRYNTNDVHSLHKQYDQFSH